MPRCSLYRHDTRRDASDRRVVVWLRLPGIALGAITLLLTATAVPRLSRDPWTPVVAAGVVAAVPRFTFDASSVANDVLVNALAALATYLAALAASKRGVEHAPRVPIVAGLGIVAASLTLTKSTGVVLVPGLVLTVVLSARGWREPLRLLAVFAVAALLCSGWWLLRNVEQYGDPLAVQATEDYLRAEDPLEFASLKNLRTRSPRVRGASKRTVVRVLVSLATVCLEQLGVSPLLGADSRWSGGAGLGQARRRSRKSVVTVACRTCRVRGARSRRPSGVVDYRDADRWSLGALCVRRIAGNRGPCCARVDTPASLFPPVSHYRCSG